MDNNFVVNEGCASQYQENFLDGFYYIVPYFVLSINKVYVKNPEQAVQMLTRELSGSCTVIRNPNERILEFQIEANGCTRVDSAAELESEMKRIKSIASEIFQVKVECPWFNLTVDVHGVHTSTSE